MSPAIEEARKALETGDIPIGAVITCRDEIVSRAHNEIEKSGNPLAHAEVLAIERATAKLGTKFLNDCSIYVTVEPCPMCAGAIVLARVGKVVFGANEPKFGACGSLYMIAADERLNHQAKIIGGIMEAECAELIKDFFRAKRENNV